MSKWKDFEFSAPGRDNERCDLRYIGENRELVIPEKMIAKAGKRQPLPFLLPMGMNWKALPCPKTFMMFGLVRFMAQEV